MQIYAEESFGPGVTVLRVKDEEQALRIANDTEYGLTAAIFGRDFARAWRLAMRVESGICPSTGRRCTTNHKCRLVK
jgi:acyl-CoA reductase-like NAD-dependent aldehyde dehydrogenase